MYYKKEVKYSLAREAEAHRTPDPYIQITGCLIYGYDLRALPKNCLLVAGDESSCDLWMEMARPRDIQQGMRRHGTSLAVQGFKTLRFQCTGCGFHP